MTKVTVILKVNIYIYHVYEFVLHMDHHKPQIWFSFYCGSRRNTISWSLNVYKPVAGKNIENAIAYALHFHEQRRIMSLCNFLFVCNSQIDLFESVMI